VAGAGTLWVTVKPSLEGFGADLRRQIEESIPPEIRVRVRPDEDTTAQGAAAAGQFADAFKAKLAAALRDLPKVNLDLDASESDRKLAELRAQLEELNGKKIGVDISAEEARAKLDELKGKLDELSRKSPDVRVRVDAGAAAAELAALRAELDKLDGKKVEPKVDTSSAQSGISALLVAGLALGPALIPIGASVGAALLSIGPAAIAGVGALAALKLAFSGMGTAITAYDQAQQAAGQNAGKSAIQQQQSASAIAGAQDGVASAERGLTQARATAADGAVSAAEKVNNAQASIVTARQSAASQMDSAINSQVSAEQSLASAQQSEQTAQENLTQARAAAAAQLAALSFSVQDNALSQRGASLTLRAAEASALQRDQAVLSVDQARQRIVELKAQGEDLVKQKATADQKGIAGSTQVVAAQNALTASVQRTVAAQRAVEQAGDAVVKAQTAGAQSIARAEQSLSDARRAQAIQAASGANSIASAQQGVVSAERSLASAHLSAASAAQSATGSNAALKKALDDLTPAGRGFVMFYESELKPRFADLKTAAQSGLFPGLQDGIRTALPALGQLKTFIGNISTALGDLAREAGKALTSPFWHQFFDFMNTTAGPAIKGIAENFGRFFQGMAGIMQALYVPVFLPILDWFTRMSKKVSDFGTSAAAGTNSSFNSFLAYVKEVGPTVADLFRQFGKLVGHVGEALAGQGFSTLSVLVDVLKWINTLPPPVLQGLIDVFTAWKLFKVADSLLTGLDGILVRLGLTPLGGIRGALSAIGGLGGLAGLLGIGAAAAGVDLLTQKLHDLADGAPPPQPAGPSGPGGNYLGGPGADGHTKSTGQKVAGIGAAAGDQVRTGDGISWDWLTKPPDLGTWHKTVFTEWLNNSIWVPVRDFFTGLPKSVTKLWKDNVETPTNTWFATQKANIKTWWNDSVWNPTRDFFVGLPGTVKKWYTDNIETPTNTWFTTQRSNIKTWWNDNVWNPTRDFFVGLPGTVKKWWTDNVENPTKAWFATQRSNITKWWNDNVWNPTRDFFVGLPGTIRKWWNDNVWNPTRDWFAALPAVVSKWWNDSVWNPTRNFFVGLAGDVGHWWDGLVGKFRDGINNVIGLMNGFAGIINDIAGKLGFSLNLHVNPLGGGGVPATAATARPISPHLGVGHALAAGGPVSGMLPGYSPGVDTIPAMAGRQPYLLAGGEYIVRPESTRQLGPAAMQAINDAYRRPVAVVPRDAREAALYNQGGPIGLAFGGFTPDPGTSGGQTWGSLDKIRQQMFPGSVLTSAYRPGDPGFHGKGEAIDIGWSGNDQGHLMPIAAALVAKYGRNSSEIIHNPNGSVQDGHNVPSSVWGPAVWAQHASHVHWAMTPAELLTAPGGALGDPGNLVSNIAAALSGLAHAALDPVRGALAGVGNQFGFPGKVAAGAFNKMIDSLFTSATAQDAATTSSSMGPAGTGDPFVIGQISDSARAHGLGFPGAAIGVATGIVESGLRNLNYGDRDSLGVFQQRPSQGWGSPADILNVRHAADSFFNRFPGGWRGMDPGAVAQGVQRSAFPGRYDTQMAAARGLVTQFGGVFDQGGWLPGMSTARNATKAPEAVLTTPQWVTMQSLASHVARNQAVGRSTGPAVSMTFHETGWDAGRIAVEVERRQDFARRINGG